MTEHEEEHEEPIFPKFVGDEREQVFRSQVMSLADSVILEEVGFLFGAGMSQASGLPTGRGLAVRMLQEMLSDDQRRPTEDELSAPLSDFPFESITEAYLGKEENSERVLVFLKDELKFGKAKHNDGHRELAKLAPRLRRVYTTNFDLLIEDAMEKSASVSPTTINELNKAEASRKLPVIHLHGMFGPDDCMLTEKELYETNPLTELFKADLLRLNFVLVGYSMFDPDLRDIYMTVQDVLQRKRALQRPTYVVGPVQSGYQLTVAIEVWKQRNARFIPTSAVQFMKLLVRCVQTRHERKRIDALVKKLDLKTDDMLEHNIKATIDEFPDMTRNDVLDYMEFFNRDEVEAC